MVISGLESNHGLNRIVPADLLKKDTTLPSIVDYTGYHQ